MSKQEQYNQMAIEWVDEYLKNNESQGIKIEGGYIKDTHYTLNLWKDRLINGEGVEKKASYVKIKKFKDLINAIG